MDRSDITAKFVLRLPMPLRDLIADTAWQNRRSMNSEIVEALRRKFDPDPSARRDTPKTELTPTAG